MRQYGSLSSVDEHVARRYEESISSTFAELDEVDAAVVCPSPQPPKVPQATYVVLSSFDIIQLTVTRSALDVLTDVVKVCICKNIVNLPNRHAVVGLVLTWGGVV